MRLQCLREIQTPLTETAVQVLRGLEVVEWQPAGQHRSWHYLCAVKASIVRKADQASSKRATVYAGQTSSATRLGAQSVTSE